MPLMEQVLYRFGPFLVDPAERLVSRDGVPLTLTPKVFDTLLCLVRNGGHVLTKDELLTEIWPDTFVEEVNLAVNISTLRKALGERPQECHYIATVPGHGYRFVAEVEEMTPEPIGKQATTWHPKGMPELTSSGGDFADKVLSSLARTEDPTRGEIVVDSSRTNRAGRSAALSVMTFLLIVLAIASYAWLARQRVSASPATQLSIAVLPFLDLSPDKSRDYFAEGVTEALIDELAKVPRLKVVARSSAFQFKGSNQDLRSVGRKLGVTNILEGSVSVQGDHVRIRAELIKADDGFQLWSETYDRNINDIFLVQDEIARAATDALELKLLGANASGPRTNALAYQAYLQARDSFGSDSNKATLRDALDHSDEAIKLDLNYAPAWALRSRLLSGMAAYGLIDTQHGYQQARADGEHAIALDPNLASGYLALGWIQMSHDWDWRRAEASLTKAAELEPGNVDVLRYKAALYTTLGRINDALELSREVVAVDPLHARSYSHLGYQFYFVGQYEEAKAALQKALELNPDKEEDHLIRGQILLAQRRPDAALAQMQQERGRVWKQFGQALAYHDLGRKHDSDAAVESLIAENQHDAAYQIAQVYAYRDEADRAFEWLELAYARHDPGLACIKYDPLLSNLRRDLRYEYLLKKMHLPTG